MLQKYACFDQNTNMQTHTHKYEIHVGVYTVAQVGCCELSDTCCPLSPRLIERLLTVGLRRC